MTGLIFYDRLNSAKEEDFYPDFPDRSFINEVINVNRKKINKNLEKMIQVLVAAGHDLQAAIAKGDLPNCTKEAVANNVQRLAFEFSEIKEKCVFSGDDWTWGNDGEESKFPKPTATIAISLRDDKGNLEACAVKTVFEDLPIVVGDKDGVWIYRNNNFTEVTAVDRVFCIPEIKPQLCVYGQKAKPHWVKMAHTIGDIIKQGIGVYNSMGPFWMLKQYFGNFDENTGTVKPFNFALCEPFANKPKEEIVFTVLFWLNQNLPENQRFIITNMAGEGAVFEGTHIKKAEPPVCEIYCAPGLIVAPTPECWATIMMAFCNANEMAIPTKVRELAKGLEAAREKIAISA
ncbi:MAG: hypothetical protein Q8N37_00660 [bacterium]|nr:hypothetical protein [bacterium]